MIDDDYYDGDYDNDDRNNDDHDASGPPANLRLYHLVEMVIIILMI